MSFGIFGQFAKRGFKEIKPSVREFGAATGFISFIPEDLIFDATFRFLREPDFMNHLEALRFCDCFRILLMTLFSGLPEFPFE